MELTATTTIRKPAPEVYAFWRDLENLPTFMAHLEEVRATGDRTSHWSAGAPFGKNVEWDAEIVEEAPGEKIAWRSTGKADVPNAGSVRFVPAPDGVSTEVHVVLVYEIPGGRVGRRSRSTSGRNRTSSSTTTCAGSSRCWRPVRWSGPTAPRGASGPAGSSRSVRRNRCRTPSSRRERTREGEHLGGS